MLFQDNDESSSTDADSKTGNESLSSESSDLEDARNLEPKAWAQSQALTNATGPTMLQYIGINGQAVEISDWNANYFSQWAFYQQRMSSYWIESGLLSVPPRLVSLDRWTGGIETFQNARILNSGAK